MRVIISHGLPFSLAHGGQQTLIESLLRELLVLGVEVEPERWWDPDQKADIQHYIQRPPVGNVRLAKQKGRMTVMTENFDVVASESKYRLFLREASTRIARKLIPSFNDRLNLYEDLDALIYVVPHEWDVIRQLYRPSLEKGFIIPHGLEPNAIEALRAAQSQGNYLVSVGTICPRKNTLLLASCAKAAKVPIVFLGKPFSEEDPYFKQFRELIDDKYVRYSGYVNEEEKYGILRGARGFVLLSNGESGCIAVYEAAAAGLPLLLSALPWAAKGYPASHGISLVSLSSSGGIVRALEAFYKVSRRSHQMTFRVGTWASVAKRYLDLYEGLLFKKPRG